MAAIIYGLSYMPSRRSSWAVKLDVGLAWFSALSVLVLVPTDVASTLQVGLVASGVSTPVHAAKALLQASECVMNMISKFVRSSTKSKITLAFVAGYFTTLVGHVVESGVLVWLCCPVHCVAIPSGICFFF